MTYEVHLNILELHYGTIYDQNGTHQELLEAFISSELNPSSLGFQLLKNGGLEFVHVWLIESDAVISHTGRIVRAVTLIELIVKLRA